MLLLAIQVLDREAVDAQLVVLVHPRADRVERDLQQFRAEPRLGLLPAGEQDLHLLAARVDRVVALVLVVLQRRVVPDAVGELTQLFREPERLEQRLGPLRQRAFQRRVAIDARFELLVGGVPRFPALEDVLDVPLESIVDLGTVAASRPGSAGSTCRRTSLNYSPLDAYSPQARPGQLSIAADARREVAMPLVRAVERQRVHAGAARLSAASSAVDLAAR